MRWYQRFFRRGLTEKQLDAELRFHLDQKIADLVATGITPEEARRRAQIEFGGLDQVKEECRDVGSSHIIESLMQDVRYGVRILAKSPGFTAVAVLMLALGIGANTAIFSVVECVLLKPLPYPHPERLVGVSLDLRGVNETHAGLSDGDYFIFREQSRTFLDIGLYTMGLSSKGYSVSVTGFGEPERVPALHVTDGVFPILVVTPLLGRSFARSDCQPGRPDTVILTYGYWRSKFGGDRSVIGRTIDVDGKPRTIIGVLPQRFQFLDKTNLAMLLPIELDRAKTYLGGYGYGGIARLKPGVTLAEAKADVARMIPIVLRSFSAKSPTNLKMYEDLRIGPNLRPLKEEVVGDAGKILWVLMGGISLVLVIAIANLGNFLLVRAEGRQQELAVRAALGAGRGRIAAELLSESLILAVLGGLLGLGLAYGALRVLVAMAPPGLPRLNEIGIDGRVMLFTLAVSVAASLLFGSVPAFKYAGAGLEIRLREGSRSMSESRKRRRSRGLLVIVQVALAVVLLVSSGLMIRTFRALTKVDPGFVAPSELQTFRVAIPDARAKDLERVVRIQEEISHKLEAIPGVSSVGFSRNLPMDGSNWSDPIFAKDHVYSPGELPICRYEFVGPGFLKTLGTPLVAGHVFTWSDIYNEVPVVMVSEKFARQYWHDPSSALDKQIRISPKGEWREVVGVVGDVHQDGADKEAPTSVYWPILMAHLGDDPDVYVEHDVAFAIRSSRAGSTSLMKDIQKAVWSVDSDLPLADVHTLDYYYMKSMARTSFTLVMLAVAGGMALLLGIVGLYGVIAYSVSQGTHEIGIRIALGAQAEDVLKMVVRGGFKLAAVGVGIGIVAALWSTRFLASLLYGVKPTDLPTFVAVSLLLIVVALVATYIPARQAAHVDPIVALRHE